MLQDLGHIYELWRPSYRLRVTCLQPRIIILKWPFLTLINIYCMYRQASKAAKRHIGPLYVKCHECLRVRKFQPWQVKLETGIHLEVSELPILGPPSFVVSLSLLLECRPPPLLPCSIVIPSVLPELLLKVALRSRWGVRH